MHVSVEIVGNLDRKMTVQLPPERIQTEVDKRLKALSKRVRLDGFRPGKVPPKVIQQRYGDGVFQEVLGETVKESYRQALLQEGLVPVGQPSIEPVATELGGPLEYIATFQVFPEVVLQDLSGVEVEKPVATIETADVEQVLESLCAQEATWHSVERPAANGDRLVIDFEGRLNGEGFEGGKAEGFTLVLGQPHLIDSLQDQLVGMTAGTQATLQVTFPDDYPAENLKGQLTEFSVTVHTVEEQHVPELDAELARKYGVADGSVETFRFEVQANMQRELEATIRGQLKKQAFAALIRVHASSFDLPEFLVKDEIERMRKELEERMPMAQSEQPLPDRLFEQEAQRRVRVGLLLRHIVETQGMVVDQERVQAELDRVARTYDDPEGFKAYFMQNQQAVTGLEMAVLEEQVAEWVMQQGTIVEKPSSFTDVMQKAKQPTLAEDNP